MNNFNTVSEIIFKLGGTGYVSKLLQTNPSTISNWKKKNKIPTSYLNKIKDLFPNDDFISSLLVYDETKDNHDYKLLNKTRILVIITGGVSCYKILELLRLFYKKKFIINVVLTDNAQKFITPLLVTSLINKKCYTDLFSLNENEIMNHINLGRDNDLILVAPSTANFLAKAAHGIADDLATNIILASNSKVLIAPSMNPFMWQNEATQTNVQVLKERGFNFIKPNAGEMACGENGIGRLPEVRDIFISTLDFLKQQKNEKNKINLKQNLKILVTAGPTLEKIDPIRHVSNNSSGKQGYAIAAEFKKIGIEVVLISGPTNIKPPNVNQFIKVDTADQMLAQVEKHLDCDIFVGTAAVCDWKLVPYDLNNNKLLKAEKLKKSAKIFFKTINNPDIISIVSSHIKRPKLVVGFAAETSNLLKNASSKLKSKNLDLVIANSIDENNQVFGSEYNEVTIIDKNYNHKKSLKLKKNDIAKLIVSEIFKCYKNFYAKNNNRKSIKI